MCCYSLISAQSTNHNLSKHRILIIFKNPLPLPFSPFSFSLLILYLLLLSLSFSSSLPSLPILPPLSQLEGLVETLRSLYEDHVHQLEREHSQFRTDSEGREQSTARLLRDLEGENERLADSNHTLQRDLHDLQNRYRATEASLKVGITFSSSLINEKQSNVYTSSTRSKRNYHF